MVLVVVPLLQGDVVRWLNILKDLFQLFRDSIVNGLAPILHNENQMVVKGEHRMIITFQNHCKSPPFPYNTDYTTKKENVQGGAIPLPPIEEGESLLHYVEFRTPLFCLLENWRCIKASSKIHVYS